MPCLLSSEKQSGPGISGVNDKKRYEPRGAVRFLNWRNRKSLSPSPDVIVRAQSNVDVVAAVQLAKERGREIGIRLRADRAGQLCFCATAQCCSTCRK